jgi:hypothetical protein
MCIKLSEVNVRILKRVVVSEATVFELSTNQQLNVNASETLISRRWLTNDILIGYIHTSCLVYSE